MLTKRHFLILSFLLQRLVGISLKSFFLSLDLWFSIYPVVYNIVIMYIHPSPPLFKDRVSCNPGWPTCCTVEHDLELLILLPPFPECWDYRECHCVQFIWCWGLNPGPCKYTANWATCPAFFPTYFEELFSRSIRASYISLVTCKGSNIVSSLPTPFFPF